MVKITYEFDTYGENFEPDELLRFQKSYNMAKALWDLSNLIRGWYKYPESSGELNADTLNDKFCDILEENDINLDELWR